jgi:hypothetical protein
MTRISLLLKTPVIFEVRSNVPVNRVIYIHASPHHTNKRPCKLDNKKINLIFQSLPCVQKKEKAENNDCERL